MKKYILSFIITFFYALLIFKINIFNYNLIYLKYYTIILFFILSLFLYNSIIEDIKSKEISDIYTIPIFIIGLLNFMNINNFMIVLTILTTIKYVSALIYKKEAFGEADLIIYTGLSSFFPLKNDLYIFITTNIIAIIYYIYYKKEDFIPMIPFLYISIYINIIYYILYKQIF